MFTAPTGGSFGGVKIENKSGSLFGGAAVKPAAGSLFNNGAANKDMLFKPIEGGSFGGVKLPEAKKEEAPAAK